MTSRVIDKLNFHSLQYFNSSCLEPKDFTEITDKNLTSDKISVNRRGLSDQAFTYIHWQDFNESECEILDKMICFILRTKNTIDRHDGVCSHMQKTEIKLESQDMDVNTMILSNLFEEFSKLASKIDALTSRIDILQSSVAEIYNQVQPKSFKTNEVFISHAGCDKGFAVMCSKFISETGFKPWIDKTEIKENNERAIYDAIFSSHLFIVIETDDYYKSEWCMKELGAAQANNKDIICLRKCIKMKRYPGNSVTDDVSNDVLQFISILSHWLKKPINKTKIEIDMISKYCVGNTWNYDNIMEFLRR